MSYTIPDSVQTKAEAVLAVASAIADEDMGARYDGTVNTSLDVLADVLAAQDVDVPQTNAGAILALAQYAHGGGGGVTLGNLQMPPFSSDGEPQIGEDIPEQSLEITNLSIGDSVALTTVGDNILLFEPYERIAAGVTIVVDIPVGDWPVDTNAKIYRATIDLPTHKYSNIELTGTVVTVTDVTIDGTAFKRASFVLPEVEDVTTQVNVLALIDK